MPPEPDGSALMASADASSTVYDAHPVRDAHAPESRALPLLLSLCLTPLAVYGFSSGLLARASFQSARHPGKTAPLLLDAWVFPPDATEPVQSPLGWREAGGAGHPEGTGTLDPNLAEVQAPALSQPTEAMAPQARAVAPETPQMAASLNAALPIKAGGNGLERGLGREASVGLGDLDQPLRPIPDHRLVLIRRVSMHYRLASKQESSAIQPLKVRILIGDDGVPFQATALSGPSFLHEQAQATALDWRFEPLRPHGLKGPVSLVLVFQPSHLGSR